MNIKKTIAASALMLGMASVANAELSSVSDEALADVTGQDGLTIDMNVKVAIGAIDYTDSDGGASATAGTLSISTLEINDGTAATHAASGGLDLSGLTIDVDGTNGLEIPLPSITGRISLL